MGRGGQMIEEAGRYSSIKAGNGVVLSVGFLPKEVDTWLPAFRI